MVYIRYIGSKKSLIEFIDSSIFQVINNYSNDNINKMNFADLFCGTGIVSKHFNQKGFNIISNDIQYYSYILTKSLFLNKEQLNFNNLKNILNISNISEEDIYEYLNKLDGLQGFIYNNYSLGGTKGKEFERLYFSDNNAKKCDAIRCKIEEWKNNYLIDENVYCYLLASLIHSINQYANTTSVYAAFLKKLQERANRDLILKSYSNSNLIGNVEVFNEDSNSLIRKIKGDILYLDPPYNNRQYCDNYHILETISKYDEPEIKGKTGLRVDNINMKSKYCYKKEAVNTLEDLIYNANFKYIFLSYNNEGIIPKEEIIRIMSVKGEYIQFQKEYKRFKSNNNGNQDKSVIEYIHCVVVN